VPERPEVHVVLTGDATTSRWANTVEPIDGVGVPPMREHVVTLIDTQVPVYV
jgi:hypothetical protein